MAIKNLDKTGLGRVWANIKSYIASKVPTKTSQLTNDSGFLTSHQSLNNYVDLTSNQILTGAKKFTGSGLYNANLVKGTLPTATSYINLALSGSNAYTSSVHRIGLLESAIDTAGTVSTYITAYEFKLGSKVATSIGVRYPLNSTPYAYAPNPDDGTSGQKIATTNWVESKKYLTSHQSLSNYVTLNSAQTISGAKTLTAIVYTQPTTTSGDAHHQHLMYTDTEKGTLPTRNYYKHLEIVDSTKTSVIAHRLSAVLVGAQTSGNTYAEFNVFKTKEAGSTRTSLGIRYDYAKDTWVTYSPTPPATDNSTQIATTAWVTAKKYLTSHQDISGKQDKIDTYVSSLAKSGNTLFIYTNSNTNSPSGSISLNTTISGGVGTTITAYYKSVVGTTASTSGSWGDGSISGNSTATTASKTTTARSVTFSYTPTVGAIYSGSYLASTFTALGTIKNTISRTGGNGNVYVAIFSQEISATATFTNLNSSYKYLCTTANKVTMTVTGAAKTYASGTTYKTDSYVCTSNLSGSKSTFLRVQ